MFNGHIERSSLLVIIRRISFVESYLGNNLLLKRIYDIGICWFIFVTDKIFDCKRNLSRFCNVAVFSGLSVENERMLTFVIYTV